jgi:hypothetical protein
MLLALLSVVADSGCPRSGSANCPAYIDGPHVSRCARQVPEHRRVAVLCQRRPNIRFELFAHVAVRRALITAIERRNSIVSVVGHSARPS